MGLYKYTIYAGITAIHRKTVVSRHLHSHALYSKTVVHLYSCIVAVIYHKRSIAAVHTKTDTVGSKIRSTYAPQMVQISENRSSNMHELG